jgi:hypothetical protein
VGVGVGVGVGLSHYGNNMYVDTRGCRKLHNEEHLLSHVILKRMIWKK